ncbi:uncharacterized protein LOC133332660, partial [Musca vetustissima]|uniref:uncharacterized protein LOC133332660 n=1 Tax=Musca vetustissima TaxID=27455 RepID=UPI002AB63C8F
MFNYAEAPVTPKPHHNDQWLKIPRPTTDLYQQTLLHTNYSQPQKQKQQQQQLQPQLQRRRQQRTTRDKQFKMVADDNVQQQRFNTQLNNANNVGTTTTTSNAPFPSSYTITPVISQILATPMKTSATAASNAITSTRSPYMLLTTSAVTAVTSTLVNSSRVGSGAAMIASAAASLPPTTPASSSYPLNISYAMTSSSASSSSSSTPTTMLPSTGSVFFEGDLLPTVFVSGNGNGNSRNNTTSVTGMMEDDDNLNSFYFYE